ncbi:transposase [Streptomyces sp. NPDC003015]
MKERRRRPQVRATHRARRKRRKSRRGSCTDTQQGRSKFTASHDWLAVIQLPSYSPDLNPVEGVWSLIRRGPMANTAFTDPTISPAPSAEASPTSSAIPNSSTAASPRPDCPSPQTTRSSSDKVSKTGRS